MLGCVDACHVHMPFCHQVWFSGTPPSLRVPVALRRSKAFVAYVCDTNDAWFTPDSKVFIQRFFQAPASEFAPNFENHAHNTRFYSSATVLKNRSSSHAFFRVFWVHVARAMPRESPLTRTRTTTNQRTAQRSLAPREHEREREKMSIR